ncbi:DUF4760 domain-containing protein [Yersinia enterocolitica]|nr:DUF4760 domain-containing protein [Yersinia enterocolitica]
MALDVFSAQIIGNAILCFGLIVAIITIIYNVKTAKKMQTAIFLFESRKDQEYIQGLHVIRKVHDSGKSFRSYVIPMKGMELTKEEKEERLKIQYILNFYERVAVSIKNGIFSEIMIKEVSYSTVVQNYGIAEPFIHAIREKQQLQTLYQEYEWLVTRWKKCPLKKNK